MVFEAQNAYFWTEEKIDEESIQDKIDRKKIEINQLTRENLKKLRVDILYSRSHLRIRDENWKIIWKLKDNEIVDFNWERKVINYKWKQKVFLWINFKKWDKIIKWFVAADYVKWDIIENKKNIKKENNTPKTSLDPKTTPKIQTEVTKEKDTKTENTKKEEIEIKENYTHNKYTFKDWRLFLIWEDNTEIEINREISKEDLEKIKKFEKVAILNEVLDIWINQAKKIANSLFWKDYRDDDEIILKEINNIENYNKELITLLQSPKIDENKINTLINKIFDSIKIAENEEDIIWIDDMQKVKEIILSKDLNKDQKLIKIFNLMRYWGLSWNSETVKEKVANHLLAQKEYKNIRDILTNKETLNYIKENNKEELAKLLWNETLAENIIESYNKIKAKQEEKRAEYRKILDKVNKERTKNWEKAISLDDFINLNVDYSIQILLKHTLIENHINKKSKRWNENNSYEWIYANISWLAENPNFDIFVISDDNIDTAIDIGSTLALAAISMWVWALAARWALMWATYLARATNLANLSSKLWKTWTVAEFLGKTWIEWYSFYVWTNTMHNIIYWEYGTNIFKNNGDIKEIAKSITLIWVLRWVQKILKTAKIKSIKDKVPDIMLKNSSIIWALTEAGILTSTSVWIEIAFEWKWEWTWEEYLQALVMVWLFKKVDKIKFSKNEKWEIKIETWSTKKPEWYKIDPIKDIKWKKTNEKTNEKPKEEIKKMEKIKEIEILQWTIYKNPKTWEIFISTEKGIFNKEWKLQKTLTEEYIKNDLKWEIIWKWKIKIEEKVVEKNKEKNEDNIDFKNIKWSTEAPIDKNAKPLNPDWTKADWIKTEKITKEEKKDTIDTNQEDILSKKLHKIFVKEFEKHFKEKNKLSLKNDDWEEIIISKTSKWKYLISWDNIIYSKKEILKKIKEDYPTFEKNFLKNKARKEYDLIVKNKKELVTERDIFHLIKWKEKITENGLEIKENWKWRLANQEEIENFLNRNPKIEKLLSKSIEEQIENEIKDKWLKKALLDNKNELLKEIFLWKKYFNLWLPWLITLAQIDDYKNIKPLDFLKVFTITYLGSVWINWAFLTLSSWAKFLLTTKPVTSSINFIKNNYGKIMFGGAFWTWVYLYHVRKD